MSRETRAMRHAREWSSGDGSAAQGRCGRACAAGLRRALGTFGRDARGIAAVEFAMVTPVLLAMLLGAVEVTRAVAIDKRVTVVTSMVADLVARETQLTANDVTAIYVIAEQVMAPYDSGPLKLSVIPVMSSVTDASTTLVYPATTNRPSYHGGAQPEKCQPYLLAEGFLKENESVIVIEASYTYTPLFLHAILGNQTWNKRAFAKPRKSLCVAFDGATCTSSCFPS